MKKILLLLCFSLPFSMLLTAQIRTEFYDGPYLLKQKDSLRIKWVEAGIGYDTTMAYEDLGKFEKEGLPKIDLTDIDFEKERQATYTGVEKIVAMSDAHGQYDLVIKLLKANKVIDENNHWIYGEGHLVITGDNLDRGDKVLDILWFLFFLEKEAAKAGGKVHVLLGNHEVMVLQGDIRYLNRKYVYTSGILRNRYHTLFAKGSVLGDWIANHKVMTSINRSLYLHGGISDEIVKLKYSIEEMNEIFTKHLVRYESKEIFQDPKLAALYDENGPLWYRGYFKKDGMEDSSIRRVLKKLNQDRIIVGHTSFDSIQSFYDGRVLGIDCSIKVGEKGQVLIYEDEKFYVGDLNGMKTPIKFNPGKKSKKKKSRTGSIQSEPSSSETKLASNESIPGPESFNSGSVKSQSSSNLQKLSSIESISDSVLSKPSFCQTLFKIEGVPKMVVNTNVKQLLRKSFKEEYQEATLQINYPNGEDFGFYNGRIRARGNIRKKVCNVPPVKFDFPKKTLDSLGFLKNDKLKFVFPCQENKWAQQKLYKEFFLYELYKFIDTNSIIVKLVDIEFRQDGQEKLKFNGFLIEDEEEYARRKNASVIEKGKVNPSRLDRTSFLKMLFFQYMIANTDWTVANRHNLELVKLPDINKVVALPYDFDYAGFVGQEYAVPHESLPIEDVNERYFFNYKIREHEFYDMVRYYKSIEKDVYRICEEATYMKAETIEENKFYLGKFFQLLERPENIIDEILKR